MIVLTWFIIIAFIILVGFTVVGLTLWHWYKQAKLEKSAKKQAAAAKPAEV